MQSSRPLVSYSLDLRINSSTRGKGFVEVFISEDAASLGNTLQTISTDMLFVKVQEMINTRLRTACQHIQRDLAKLEQ